MLFTSIPLLLGALANLVVAQAPVSSTQSCFTKYGRTSVAGVIGTTTKYSSRTHTVKITSTSTPVVSVTSPLLTETTTITSTSTAPTSTTTVTTYATVTAPAGFTPLATVLSSMGLVNLGKRMITTNVPIKTVVAAAIPTGIEFKVVDGQAAFCPSQYPQSVTCKAKLYYNEMKTITKYAPVSTFTVRNTITVFPTTTITTTPIATQTVAGKTVYEGCQANNVIKNFNGNKFVSVPVINPFMAAPLQLASVTNAADCCAACFDAGGNCGGSSFLSGLNICLLIMENVCAAGTTGMVFGIKDHLLIPGVFLTLSNGPCGQWGYNCLLNDP